jgi:hypothetical protein
VPRTASSGDGSGTLTSVPLPPFACSPGASSSGLGTPSNRSIADLALERMSLGLDAWFALAAGPKPGEATRRERERELPHVNKAF